MTRNETRRARPLAIAAAIAAGVLFGGASSSMAVSTVKLTSRTFEHPGPSADVVVAINVAPADGVTMMDFTFDYDPLSLAATAVDRTGYSSGFSLSSTIATPGVVEIHMSGAAPLAGVGDVVWVTFRVLAPAGTMSSLTWFSALLNAGGIPSQTQDGTVAVVAAQTTISCPDAAQGGSSMPVTVPISASTLDFCIGGSNNGGACTTNANCPGGGSCGATSIDLSLLYDPTILSVTSVAKTPITSSMMLVTCLMGTPPCQPGALNIALYGSTPVRGSGALVTVTLTVTGGIGSRTPLNVIRGGINEGLISSNLDDGLFTVCDDLDGDGDAVTGCAGDCDNANPGVHPGAAEVCNGIDDDCDGSADEAASCSDGNACTTPDACVDGSCIPGAETDCDDGSLCTDDSCNTVTGACVHADNTAPCSDGDECTLNDACSAGTCSGSPSPPPAEINDTVRVTESGGVATVAWSDAPGPYDLYRGLLASGAPWSYDQTCYAGATGSASVQDGDSPGVGGLFFYLVARRSACGRSVAGRDSQGDPIPTATPCP